MLSMIGYWHDNVVCLSVHTVHLSVYNAVHCG